MTLADRTFTFTVDDLDKLYESGVLGPETRVELLEGRLIEMSPPGPQHSSVVRRLNRLLHRAVGDRGLVSIQDAVRFSHLTQLMPDVVVLKPRDDFYSEALPGPSDVLLLIEVAYTSHGYDRREKLPHYAADGIPEYWLIDVPNRQIECYSQPVGRAYTDESIRQPGETVTTKTLGQEFEVETILGS